MKSVAKLASDPLQHFAIETSGNNYRKNVFRLGQKMDGQKYVTRKKVFIFLPSHVFAQT
jgi:hypothetical protein